MAYPWQTGYNPYFPAQPQMPQMQPMQMQQPIQQQPMPLCRPVTSPDEAKNTPVDFMGNLMIFPDVQNNRIYTKRWNANSGMAEFCEFVPSVPVAQEEPKEDPMLMAIREVNAKVDALMTKIGGINNEQQ